MCNWCVHRKYLVPELHNIIPCQKALCNRGPVQLGNEFPNNKNPDPPFHAFFPKKHGLAEKSAVSLLFCPFLPFFCPKKAPFPCFRVFRPRFFRLDCAFLSPQMPFALRKSEGRNDTKKAQETKKAQKGGSGNVCVCNHFGPHSK